MLQDLKLGLAHVNLQLPHFLHTQGTVTEEKVRLIIKQDTVVVNRDQTLKIQ